MNYQSQLINKNSQLEQKTNELAFIHFTRKHIELIASIFSGMLIVTALLIETNAYLFYLLAYIIGGFAKAKEGVTVTVTEKKLNVELLMLFAAIGAAIIGYWLEGALLIFIFSLSGALETYSQQKNRKEINSLIELKPEEATLIMNGTEEKISVSDLKIGNLIAIKPGERVPADGVIHFGATTIDEAALTGESLPVSKKEQAEVYAGTLNINGHIIVEVTKSNEDTTFQKIIHLIEQAEDKKSQTQQKIDRFEDMYVKVIIALVTAMFVIPYFFLGWSFQEAFYRSMILLVVASPCAVVASITPAALAAISNGARQGILFKGGITLEGLEQIKVIAFDKTGTLTIGKPFVTDFLVINQEKKLEILSAAASIENQSTHPLGNAIVEYAKSNKAEIITPECMEEISGNGIIATMYNKNWKVGKREFACGNTKNNYDVEALLSEGKTLVYISNEDGLQAIFAIKDLIRENAKIALDQLKKAGIKTVMLTGDNKNAAALISSECGIDLFFAECFPENKLDHIKDLKEKYGNIAMVGDGINDGPALKNADIGIAVGKGSDVAIEIADIILIKNNLEKISNAIKLSKRFKQVITQNLLFSIAVIITLIISNLFQGINLPLGVIGHEGSTILVILNGLRLLKN